MKKILFLLLMLPGVSNAQMSKQDSVWLPLKFLIGRWTGEAEGKPGKGKYERSYEWVLNKKYMEVKNKSVYMPTTNNPKGEVHEDRGFISYDKSRKTFVFRQFHIEGFVNHYKLESTSFDGSNLVFVTEAIENIPAGYRAKETYQIVNENEFIEIFELAEPGKEFEIYSKAILRRVK